MQKLWAEALVPGINFLKYTHEPRHYKHFCDGVKCVINAIKASFCNTYAIGNSKAYSESAPE